MLVVAVVSALALGGWPWLSVCYCAWVAQPPKSEKQARAFNEERKKEKNRKDDLTTLASFSNRLDLDLLAVNHSGTP